jgi:hypothetical protein
MKKVLTLMTMKKNLLFLVFCGLIILSCKSWFITPAVDFIITNETKRDLKSIEIYMVDDSVKSGTPRVTNKIISLEAIPAGTSTKMISIELKKISKTGKGEFYVIAKEANGNILKNGGGRYRKYQHYNDSFVEAFFIKISYIDDITLFPIPFVSSSPILYRSRKDI